MIKGEVCKISKKALKGWAFDSKNDKPVEVELLVGETVVSRTLANMMYPFGNHDRSDAKPVGFKFSMTNIWHQLSNGSQLAVRSQGKYLIYTEDRKTQPPVKGSKSLNGMVFEVNRDVDVDPKRNNCIRGFAFDNNTTDPVFVELRVDDHVINSTYASQYISQLSDYNDGYVGFLFGMRNVWKHLKAGQKISVVANNAILPFPDGKYALKIKKDGEKCNNNIIDMVQSGYLITNFGAIQKPKNTNKEWSEKALPEYAEINYALETSFGKSAFAFYGVLLGYARDKGIMAHDQDLDLAYFSEETDPIRVREEFYEISKFFIKMDKRNTPFKKKIQFSGRGMSMTPCWFTEGNFYSTFAFVGDGYHVEKKDILPLKVRNHDEYEILLPNNVINVARYLYGRGWKYPDTGWRWLPEYKRRPITLQAQLTDQQVAQLIALK